MYHQLDKIIDGSVASHLLSTDWLIISFEYSIDRAPSRLEAFPLRGPDGPALAMWLGGRAQDRCEGVSVDVHLKVPCRKAVGYDPMNGVSQGLSIGHSGDSTLLQGVLVRDWPLIIRLSSE